MLIAKAEGNNAIEIFRRALTKSEPVIFSTDTIYGIGAPVSDVKSNEKIFDIKGRDRTKPFPILISSLKQLSEIAIIESEKQLKALEEVWPAPVTFILKAKKGLNPLFTINGTVAVRMPDKKWLLNLIDTVGPVSATSANLSGENYSNSEKAVIETFKSKIIFFIFDNNQNVESSSIIDISQDTYKVTRASHKTPDLTNIFV
ncbi:SUA5/yciO/yrdC domain protein [Denitrovibrio acetiphilus DSM 12809]|uniref:L-threonylcarbamoyladenylate synthase n=1 Tax=Denitrovibrio acetiphilus (strain DSM 12809 / NBRC 114555 / N2460) TaxID=522772 RepID=D4H0M6_DENA2|nr:L-threonylcarbamoyladenylate synthase [Denitrovibrio acetiphilus]ADD68539.1 SUA5/yciO/yrdC domain protein [Denitrovibrio acetiphilus DSM 12809]